MGCRGAMACLETHCRLVRGGTSKEVLEVFHQEIGLRLSACVTRDLINHLFSFIGSQHHPKASEAPDNIPRGWIPSNCRLECLSHICCLITRANDSSGVRKPQDAGRCIHSRRCKGSGSNCAGCNEIWRII